MYECIPHELVLLCAAWPNGNNALQFVPRRN